jgi:TATA-binding protein-associated factor
MRDTLEERVMGLQQFKLDMANAVVNQDNVSLKEMDTSQLLDLFGGQQKSGLNGSCESKHEHVKKQSGLQAMLSNMGELWDESQYTNEFSMTAFMGKMGAQKQ